MTATLQTPAKLGDEPAGKEQPPPMVEEAIVEEGGSLRWLINSGPTLLVILLLGAVAALGHHTDWKLPSFSELTGVTTTRDDWCAEHGVPEALCIECNSELMPEPKRYGWCKIHGVHDCPLCHPDVAQLAEPRPVTAADLARAERALAVAERTANNTKCQLHLRRIQFASHADVEKAGIDIGVAWQAPVIEAIVANGEVAYDQTRLVHFVSPVPGTIWSVEKDYGQLVRKGEVLALVNAAAVGQAKSEFLQALAQLNLRNQALNRMQKSEGALAGKLIREAAAAAHESRVRVLSAQQALVNLGLPINADEWLELPESELLQSIRFLGIPEDLVERIEGQVANSNLLPLRAPLDCVVIDRDARLGEFVDTTKSLFNLADTSRMWLLLNVRSEDAGKFGLGQKVEFKPDAQGTVASGTIAWISTAADEIARTVKVRVELENPDGQLRAGTYGTGRILLREEKEATVVSSEAVHWDGSCHVLFVRDKDYLKKDAFKVFHTRTVRPGVKQAELTEIIAGVLPSECVATKGSAVLLAQLLKNNLGAG